MSDVMDDEDYEFDYEDSDQDQDDGQVDMENEYYTAKGVRELKAVLGCAERSCCKDTEE